MTLAVTPATRDLNEALRCLDEVAHQDGAQPTMVTRKAIRKWAYRSNVQAMWPNASPDEAAELAAFLSRNVGGCVEGTILLHNRRIGKLTLARASGYLAGLMRCDFGSD